jgi:hypothetical protein
MSVVRATAAASGRHRPASGVATERENSAIKSDCNDFFDFVVVADWNHNILC